MQWIKLGKIFDPTQHNLINNCVEYAQSPQTLIFDEFVRIYFSTRERDSSGKYLSHVSSVDMTKDFKKVLNISSETIIKLGDLGCFDEHGIFPVNVLRYKDKVYAYTTGWNRRISVSTDAAIGLAISDDEGVTFKKIGKGPVLNASLNEPFLVGDAFVKYLNSAFHMWYIHGTDWSKNDENGTPERVYKIAHAISDDGVEWKKEGKQIIEDKINSDECQALPTVIKVGSDYHMYFCYRHATDFRKNKDKSYRLGYAFSHDLESWTRDDASAGIDISEDSWDSDMMCYPHVFKMDSDIYMLYNGNEFGRFGFGLAKLIV